MPRSDLLAEIRREGYTLGAIWRFARVSLARVSRGLPEHPELVRPVAAMALALFVLQFVAAMILSFHVSRGTGVSYLIASSLMLLFISFWVLVHVGLQLGSPDAQRVIRMPLLVALLVSGTVYFYVCPGPLRIPPTLFGKLTGLLTTVLLGILLLGMTWWSEATRHRLMDLFAVGIGVMAVATIIQVVFIGLANR